jgi:predicted amidohydrolase YtcJ
MKLKLFLSLLLVTAMDPNEIEKVKVVKTITDGRVVYGARN